MHGEADGEVALEGVEKKRGDTEAFAAGARNIGGADVAAAGFAHIFFAEGENEEIADRDGAEEIRGGEDEEPEQQKLDGVEGIVGDLLGVPGAAEAALPGD